MSSRVVAVWPAMAADLALWEELGRLPALDLHVLFATEGVRDRGVPGRALFNYSVLPGHHLATLRGRGDSLVWNPGLTATLRSLRPHVLLVGGWGTPTCVSALLWALRHDIPTVVVSESRVRGNPVRWLIKRAVLGLLLRRVSAFVTYGIKGADYLRALGAHGPIIVAGSNRDLVRVRGAVDSLRRPAHWTEPITFGYIGRLVRTKGVDTLLQAFKNVAARRPDVRLVVAGDGPLAKSVSAVAGILPGRLDHLGAVAFDDIPQILARIHVLVLPSRMDTWALVVPEAMAAGLPVIVSDAVGSAERFLQPGRTGWIFSSGSVSELERLMLEAVHADLRRMGGFARSEALQEDVRVLAARLAPLLHKMGRYAA